VAQPNQAPVQQLQAQQPAQQTSSGTQQPAQQFTLKPGPTSPTNEPRPVSNAEFRDKTISSGDLSALSADTQKVSFVSCRSEQWNEIGRLLAGLPVLTAVSAEECDSGDALCAGLGASQSLQ